MPLGIEVGLVPGDIVLDGNPAPQEKGAQPPNFGPMSIVAKRSAISGTAAEQWLLNAMHKAAHIN